MADAATRADAAAAPRAGTRLCEAMLDALPPAVARPRYDRRRLQPGIVHLGIGAFARAHLAAATDAALAAGDGPAWGIVGVSLRHADTRDALAPQQGLYTLALRDADGAGRPRRRLQVLGCVTHLLVAPEDPKAVLEAIAHPAARILSLTVTEKGYLHEPASGRLRADDPAVVHDLAHPQAPLSAPGFVVHGLARRRARGLPPLTLLSLDNLPHNGRLLRGLVLDFAERVDPALARWIDAGCGFPCSMVDRIVPATTAVDRAEIAGALGVADAWPVVAEPFFDWAVEDRFVAGRPDWRAGGARFVADAAPSERLKLRMVNGAHSCIAYLGLMAGWATVGEAMAQPELAGFVEALLRDEVQPTLPPLPGLDLDAYRAALLARFANPALAHGTRQIAMDGSQKLPQRLLATVRERLDAAQDVQRLALGIAAWLHHLRGRDEAGRAYAIDDPLAAPLLALYRNSGSDISDAARAARLLGFTPLFGDLAQRPAFVQAVAEALGALESQGVRATLARAAIGFSPNAAGAPAP